MSEFTNQEWAFALRQDDDGLWVQMGELIRFLKDSRDAPIDPIFEAMGIRLSKEQRQMVEFANQIAVMAHQEIIDFFQDLQEQG